MRRVGDLSSNIRREICGLVRCISIDVIFLFFFWIFVGNWRVCVFRSVILVRRGI